MYFENIKKKPKLNFGFFYLSKELSPLKTFKFGVLGVGNNY